MGTTSLNLSEILSGEQTARNAGYGLSSRQSLFYRLDIRGGDSNYCTHLDPMQRA
jgi:hypothetical protein